MYMGPCPILRVLDEIATDVPPDFDNAQDVYKSLRCMFKSQTQCAMLARL